MRCICLLLSIAAVAGVAQAAQAPHGILVGLPLADVLNELRASGLRIVFSSGVVRPEMKVEAEPESDEPRARLDELLEPHGLVSQEGLGGILVVVRKAGEVTTGIRGQVRSSRDGIALSGVTIEALPAGPSTETSADGSFELLGLEPGGHRLEVRRPGFVVLRAPPVTIAGGEVATVELELRPAPPAGEQIEVSPSRLTLLQQDPASLLALSRDELLQLPHLGGDVFRALPLMPGTAANDLSARFHVRGGRRDEVQILVDGQEIYDAFHLKDFDDALSIVEAQNLERIDLSTGGFPGEYGDRMSGVLDMTTIAGRGDHRHHLGLGVLTLEAGSSGDFGDDRGSWLLALRFGTINLAGRLFGDENPQYADLFGKASWSISPRQELRLNLLAASDSLDLTEILEDELKLWDTKYDSRYSWLTHQLLATDRLLVETAVSWSGVDRDRNGVESEEEQEFGILDTRDLRVSSLRQGWSLQATPRQLVKWGFELRRYETVFDYSSEWSHNTPLAEIRALPEDGEILFQEEIDGSHFGGYLSDRWRLLGRLTLDLGLRYDRLELQNQSFFSPRLSASWALRDSTVLRAAWGHYYQSQRPYELQVEDGETEYAQAERSEHRILGIEHHFSGGSGRSAWAIRLEAYRHRIKDPRTRYENLYEAINVFPEVEPDRVRIDPESSRSQGLELFLRGQLPHGFDLWLSYTYSSIEDRFADYDAPRQIDQPHALNLRLGYRFGPRWTINAAWRYHTGWPTTPATLEVTEPEEEGDDPEQVVVLGPLNSRRLSSYHRLDVRLSRRWPVRRGEMTFYVDVQNLYNRKNLAGFDVEIDEEVAELVFVKDAWPGIFPSLGFRWDF